MPFRVTFDLDDKDLRYFRANMKQAQAAAAKLSDEEVISSAEQLVEEIRQAKVPMFVAIRVAKLSALIDMVKDEDWRMDEKERKNVLAALAYLADPQNMIPDNIPVLGFIDDAIMIELLTAELRPEIDAYNDFCRYRKDAGRRKGKSTSQEDFLASKRKELHGRMRRRRASKSRASSTRTRFRLF